MKPYSMFGILKWKQSDNTNNRIGVTNSQQGSCRFQIYVYMVDQIKTMAMIEFYTEEYKILKLFLFITNTLLIK